MTLIIVIAILSIAIIIVIIAIQKCHQSTEDQPYKKWLKDAEYDQKTFDSDTERKLNNGNEEKL